VKKQLVIWFVLSTIMSMFLPNAVVAATLCPIAVAMIRFSASDTEKLLRSDTSYLILLAIVWGAGLGGFGTPLGGAMNLVAITHIENVTGQEYMYITWTLKMLPYLAILAAGTCIYLLLIKTKTKHLPGSHTYFAGEYKKLGRMKRTEIVSLALFLAAVALAFTRPLYQSILPEFKPYYAFLLMGIIGFLIRGTDQKPLISWKFAAQNINWGLMILFSGGLAAGGLLISSGAADAIAAAVTSLDFGGAFPVVLIFVMLGMFLANASSNTAAVSVLIPIVVSITAALAMRPLPYIYVAAAACNCAFVLPTSIRAIPTGYGLSIQYMMKKGLAAIAICLVLLSAAGYIGVVFF
jgi:sodium-dependent dicarboxylate transporter 2/3/5